MNSTALPRRDVPYLPGVAPNLQHLHSLPRSPQYPSQRAAHSPQHARYPSKTVNGILKAPVPVVDRLADDTDAWGGVKAVTASSRPPSKLKAMFHLWKSNEKLKTSKTSMPPSPPPPTERPPQIFKPMHPPATKHRLRFIDAVELIPRPEVDSDPYEDEDEDEEEEDLPPSPRRGSMIWTNPQDPYAEFDLPHVIDHTDAISSSPVSSASQPSLSDYYLAPPVEPPVQTLKASSSGPASSPLATPTSTSYVPPSNATSADGHASRTPHSSSYAGWNESRQSERKGPPSAIIQSSGSNLVGTSVSPEGSQYARMPSSNAAGGMAYASSPSSAKSHRDHLQTIFPSPSQTAVSARDLLFTK